MAVQRTSVTRAYALAAALLSCVLLVGAWWERSRVAPVLDQIDDETRSVLSEVLFHVAGQPVRVFFLVKTFLFLVFLHLVSRAARLTIGTLARRNPHFDQHRELLLSRGVSLLVYSVGLLLGITVERISLNTFVVVGGTLGVGIGFGLQSLVSNFVAGTTLLIEQPIRLGDRIEFGDKAGEVVRVGSRTSWLRTYDNAILVIPNSELSQ